jgi:AraC-like DNA-binding protein
MLARDYLNLSLVRLRNGSNWQPASGCLTFVFPTSGGGRLVPEGPETVSPPDNADRKDICAGEGTAAVDTLGFAAGDVLVLSGSWRGALHNASRRTALAFSTFSLCTEHLFPLFAGRDIALLNAITDTFKAPKLYPADSAVAVECHSLLQDVPARFDIDHRSQLLRAASAVLASEFKSARAQHRVGFVRAEEHISSVLEALSVTEILESSVDDLAKKFGCTARHLNRLFHHHFGFSVSAFKMEMRLLKAASLLCDPTAKVIYVASQCGFNFLSQFNICFKRRFGASPGQWRKKKPGATPPPVNPAQGDHNCRMLKLGLCPWGGAGG